MKTNAARLLDRLGIAYTVREYSVDPDDLSAASVAAKIDLPLEQVFKTLLCRLQDGTYVFAVVPGGAELDLKKLAVAAGAKKAEMAALKDVEPLTGYIRGGVTAMAAKRDFATFADESLELFDAVSLNKKKKSLQLLLAPAGYLRATDATLADLTKVKV